MKSGTHEDVCEIDAALPSLLVIACTFGLRDLAQDLLALEEFDLPKKLISR